MGMFCLLGQVVACSCIDAILKLIMKNAHQVFHGKVAVAVGVEYKAVQGGVW